MKAVCLLFLCNRQPRTPHASAGLTHQTTWRLVPTHTSAFVEWVHNLQKDSCNGSRSIYYFWGGGEENTHVVNRASDEIMWRFVRLFAATRTQSELQNKNTFRRTLLFFTPTNNMRRKASCSLFSFCQKKTASGWWWWCWSCWAHKRATSLSQTLKSIAFQITETRDEPGSSTYAAKCGLQRLHICVSTPADVRHKSWRSGSQGGL